MSSSLSKNSANNNQEDESLNSNNNVKIIIHENRKFIIDVENNRTILHWIGKVNNILIMKKPNDTNISTALYNIASYLTSEHDIKVFVEPKAYDELNQSNSNEQKNHILNTWDDTIKKDHIDAIITLGGDGTVMWANKLFNGDIHTPPIVAFAMGSLGFLTPFPIEKYKTILSNFLKGNVTIARRKRIKCYIIRENLENLNKIVNYDLVPYHYCLNEAVIARYNSNLTNLDMYVDGIYFTKVLADGLIVSTPTGSTAYSLSAGGSVVHPSVPCTLLTPICPHSLAFRPLVIPDHLPITLVSNKQSLITFDGHNEVILNDKDAVHIIPSHSFIPMLCKTTISNDWHDRIVHLLSWNSRGSAPKNYIK